MSKLSSYLCRGPKQGPIMKVKSNYLAGETVFLYIKLSMDILLHSVQ